MDIDEDTLAEVQQSAVAPPSEHAAESPEIAFDFWSAQSEQYDTSSDGASQHAEAQEAGQEEATRNAPDRSITLHVLLPELLSEFREQYEQVQSDVVEKVLALSKTPGHEEVVAVEFTDGAAREISLHEIASLQNGMEAMDAYFQEEERKHGKRKRGPNDEWSDSSIDSDMEVDEEIERNSMKSINGDIDSRAKIRPNIRSTSIPKESESDDSAILMQPRRSLRSRQPRLPETSTNVQNEDSRSGPDEEGDEDDFFLPVVSDLNVSRRSKRRAQRPRRPPPQKRLSGRRQTRLHRESSDSEIEFEQPRRSGRATQTIRYAQDDLDLDEESFYRVEENSHETPKVVSVKELFRPLATDSSFVTSHMTICHTCRGSSSRGQLIHCQGCTYSYHKHCIGPRNQREHLVTKVGEADFVLQCRFCIEIQQKKDPLAPRLSKCQICMSSGQCCNPFSKRQTPRQEEKMREQNGGVDPVSVVSKDLINNAEHTMFRCCSCHRAWHKDHLPPIGSHPSTPDQLPGALKDYSIDWQCNECTMAQQKIHRLVAWRIKTDLSVASPSFADVNDDEKEYLVKWDTLSYFHCTWMPGAWIYGVAAGASRNAFAKRANEIDLFKTTEKEAIPEEYLMIDIIFRVKLGSKAPKSHSKEEDLGNVSQITKVYVKFQGLGYDDVVWDKPPAEDSGELYAAFKNAYQDYLSGHYFSHSSQNKMRERIKTFRGADFEDIVEQPSGLKRGKLMGYQVEGLNWLVSNYHSGRSVILADEMGLGKTVQVISLVTYLVQEKPRCWPFLVSVPNATCPNWRREFKQWAPDLRVVTYHGGKEPQDMAFKYELFPAGSNEMAAHVVIMSYDSTQDPRTKERFSSVRWAGLVVDEGQRLKNDRNLLYQALRGLKIPFRLLLTGTPLQNNKRELFNLIQFIDHSQNAEKLDEEFSILDKQTLPKLHEKIRPYFLRRTKLGVLKFLPPMAQIILPVTMTVIQEKLSKSIMAKNPQLIKAIFANGKVGKKDRGSLNNILMQLRKCLCHPFMYSEAIEEKHEDPLVMHRNLVEASAKLLLLEVMLPRLKERGHRVLIFSQFLQQLDILEDFLNGVGFQFRRLDGQLSSLEKQRRIDAFNAPDSPIFAFLLSTRAGGVGINLATADTVIIMDPDFNPHQDIQALSRAHRIGQKKKVLCFQLMMKDTVEERIMQIGKKKMALDHALIEAMDDGDLAGDDLESILKHGAQALFSENYQKGAIQYDGTSVDKLLDRSQIEQAKDPEAQNDGEGSAETQFSYARVWANDKASLEDSLAVGADEAPEPVSSSVWDKILAEREAEARRQAEATQERLGRGGRRRTANNYSHDALAEFLEDGDTQQKARDDSSDDFAGVDASSSDETEAAGDTDQTTRATVHDKKPKAPGERQGHFESDDAHQTLAAIQRGQNPQAEANAGVKGQGAAGFRPRHKASAKAWNGLRPSAQAPSASKRVADSNTLDGESHSSAIARGPRTRSLVLSADPELPPGNPQRMIYRRPRTHGTANHSTVHPDNVGGPRSSSSRRDTSSSSRPRVAIVNSISDLTESMVRTAIDTIRRTNVEQRTGPYSLGYQHSLLHLLHETTTRKDAEKGPG